MRISQHTSQLTWHVTDEESIRLIREYGFDAYDFSMTRYAADNPLYGDGWEAYVRGLRDCADSVGIVCNQAHALFPPRRDDPKGAEYNATIDARILRNMRAAAILGAPHIVIHPISGFPYRGREAYWMERNMAFYRSLEPYAEELGIRIAVENMYAWDPVRSAWAISSCMDPHDMAQYVDELGANFTACLDVGHAALCGFDPADCVRILGRRRLGALHVQDTVWNYDGHQPPYCGRVDWETFCTALGEIDYQGDLTLECDAVLAKMPASCIPGVMRYLHDSARALAAMTDAHRPQGREERE